MQQAFRFRLYPNQEQMNKLRQNIGGARFMWNALVADEMVQYKADQETPLPDGKRHPRLTYTQIKKLQGNEWLAGVDSLALANVSQQYRTARKRFFDWLKKHNGPRVGMPKFHKKWSTRWSYSTNNQPANADIHHGSVRLDENNKHVVLPKIGSVRVKAHRQLIDNWHISTATITEEKSGKWYITLLVEIGDVTAWDKTGSVVGIDLGLSRFLTASDGKIIERVRFIKNSEHKLAKAQRKLSRQREVAKKLGKSLAQSKNYQKQRIVVAKLHEKIRNQRMDFLNKVSTQLVKNHDVIGYENLSSRNMQQNHKLAKAIADVGWYSFVLKLQYKADWHGKQTIGVAPAYTTQTDYETGEVVKKLLNVRKYVNSLGHTIDRDLNASLNIRDKALATLQ